MFPPIKFKRVVIFTLILLSLLTTLFIAHTDNQTKLDSSIIRQANLDDDDPHPIPPTQRFFHLSVYDGMATNSLIEIIQDGQDYNWIGSYKRLAREIWIESEGACKGTDIWLSMPIDEGVRN